MNERYIQQTSQSQPATVACKMEAQLEHIQYTQCTHVLASLAQICMFSRCLSTKFLHWSSGETLLRVRCWLGIAEVYCTYCSFFPSAAAHVSDLQLSISRKRRRGERKKSLMSSSGVGWVDGWLPVIEILTNLSFLSLFPFLHPWDSDD